MKKKLLGMLLSMLAIMVIAGCSSKTSETTETTETPAEVTVGTATMDDVKAALADANAIVVDARLNDIYAGWAIEGNARGGHIPGATDFAASNITAPYDEDGNLEKLSRAQVLDDMLANKGIAEGKKVIVYDTNGSDAKTVADFFVSKGLTDVSVYDAKEWVNGSEALDSYPNYQLWVPASVVKAITEGNTPEGFTTKQNIKIVDVRWGGNEESGYTEGHIPTAVHVNTDDFEPPVDLGGGMWDYRLTDDQALLQLVLNTGITSEDCVIMTSPEPMASTRFAVICKYLGVDDVRVMSSGFIGWEAAGYELEKGEHNPTPATDFGVTVPANPSWIDTTAQTAEFLKGSNYTLVDNRTIEEYEGKISGYSYHEHIGKIPGAVYGKAGIGNSSSMYYYRNVDKSMRNAAEILDMWQNELGIDTNTHMAFMCGGGWRAAEVLWDAKVMGLDNTSLYSEGWCGWSNDGMEY